ncbi:MAG: hypothetical protein K8953_05255 [Proteobacteria bacterium]|nr:hypothetical protein [Pseudomonadota bacterium]
MAGYTIYKKDLDAAVGSDLGISSSGHQHEWMRVSAVNFTNGADNTEENQQAFQDVIVKINNGEGIPARVGLFIIPEQQITDLQFQNKNAVPVSIEYSVGNGDVRDYSVSTPTGRPLQVSIQGGGATTIDNGIENPVPVSFGTGGSLDVAQVRPKQYINQATGHITLPLRRKAIAPSTLHASYFRGGRDYHNGIRGDYVSFARSSSLNYAFYCMEFLGQAQVFNSNPRRKKLTIRVEENTHAIPDEDADLAEQAPSGIIISNAPFNLGGEFSFLDGEASTDEGRQALLDHYIDTLLCRLGGFVPQNVELWDINTLNMGNQIIKTEHIIFNRRYLCDTAYGGGFVSGVYSGRRASNFARNAFTNSHLIFNDQLGGTNTIVNNVHATSGGLGIFVGGDSAFFVPRGETHVITHQGPVWALSADSTSSLLAGRQEDYRLANFVWEEEYYVDNEIT